MKYKKQVDEFIGIAETIANKKGYTLENKVDLVKDPIDPAVAGDIELFEDVNIDDQSWAVLAGDTYLIRKQVFSIFVVLDDIHNVDSCR